MSSRPPQSWLGRLEAAGRAAETALLTVLLLSLTGIAFAQIILRNVFASGWSWADGLGQILVLWIAVVGALAATRDRRHISINLASRLVRPDWHRWVLVATDAFAAAVTGYFAWQAWRFVADSRAFGDILLDGVPAWILQSVLPIGFALICWRFAIHALAGAARR